MSRRIERIPYHAVKRKSVSAHMICYATPTAPAAVEAIYPHVDQIIIAYGPVKRWADWPEGGVLKRLRALPDPDGKIEINARAVWENKLQMRSWIARQVRGNYMLMLDADEIWVGLDKLLASDLKFGTPRWVNLWHDLEHWICDTPKLGSGQRWGYPVDGRGSVCPHYRFSWWRHSYRFRSHPVPVDHAGNPLTDLQTNKEVAEAVPGCEIYHLGHALPEDLMARKHQFYQERDGAPAKRHEAWHKWKGKLGLCPDGKVQEVTWELPNIVKAALPSTVLSGGR